VIRLTGGRIVDPANKRDEIGDIWIDDNGTLAEAAAQGSPRTGRDRLGIFEARLPQMRVQVDESGRDEQALRDKIRA